MKTPWSVVGVVVKGKPAFVSFARRASVADLVDSGRLHWDGMVCSLDANFMPPRLARALPPAYLHAPASAWEEFVNEALYAGWLKKG